MTEEDDYYPTWRSALQDNGGYANLWCLIKYLAWHGSYLMFIVAGTIFTAIVVPLVLGYRILKFLAIRTGRFLKDVVEGFIQFLPIEKTEGIEKKFDESVDRVSAKPIGRRIVHYCPVELSITPKWYGNLASVGESIISWAEPPKTVYVCDNCSVTRSHKNDGEDCRICNDGTYVETTDKKATEVHPDADP